MARFWHGFSAGDDVRFGRMVGRINTVSPFEAWVRFYAPNSSGTLHKLPVTKLAPFDPKALDMLREIAMQAGRVE